MAEIGNLENVTKIKYEPNPTTLMPTPRAW